MLLRHLRPGACLALGLLLGCPAPGAPTYPDSCEDGEILVAEGGHYRCQAPAAAPLTLRDCSTVLAPSTDRAALRCVPTPGVASALAEAQAAVAAAEADLARVRGLVSARPARFVGVTTTTTAGRITAPGEATGLGAARARCAAEYPGARMCSLYDLYRSLLSGALGDALPRSWIYFGCRSSQVMRPPPAWVEGRELSAESGCVHRVLGHGDDDRRGPTG